MTFILKRILILIMFYSITSCNSQTKETFKFEYLNVNNDKLKDSTKLKLKFYFNEYSLKRTNKYLSNLESFKKLKQRLSKKSTFSYLKDFDESYYAPSYLKRKKIKNKSGFTDFVLDTLFYENIKIESLKFISEQHYDRIENLRLTRLEYDKNINSIIKFEYNLKSPIYFIGNKNKIRFNINFLNISSKDIKSFKGTIFINNNEMENIFRANIDSKILPYQNDLKSELENWDIRVINEYRTDTNELEIEVSSYTKSILKQNIKKLNLTFIPTQIIFNDGSVMYQ
ncbi:exported hypothetical protein [Tenacibaculum maritimum]|nr:exported hypothetical protein [Tenacibaculum maritimum]